MWAAAGDGTGAETGAGYGRGLVVANPGRIQGGGPEDPEDPEEAERCSGSGGAVGGLDGDRWGTDGWGDGCREASRVRFRTLM